MASCSPSARGRAARRRALHCCTAGCRPGPSPRTGHARRFPADPCRQPTPVAVRRTCARRLCSDRRLGKNSRRFQTGVIAACQARRAASNPHAQLVAGVDVVIRSLEHPFGKVRVGHHHEPLVEQVAERDRVAVPAPAGLQQPRRGELEARALEHAEAGAGRKALADWGHVGDRSCQPRSTHIAPAPQTRS
jgi:hypothetical protein